MNESNNNQESSSTNTNEAEVLVDNLPDFIKELKEIVDEVDKKEYAIFFRGHSNKKYLLVPSLLRNDKPKRNQLGEANLNAVNNEHIAFRDIVAIQSSEFTLCKSAIEHLVKMQHFGLKTRLLDITSNALVALYFACTNPAGNISNNEGQVIVFKIPKTVVKHFDSDTISAVANLAKCKPDDFSFLLCGNVGGENDFVTGVHLMNDSQTNKKYQLLAVIHGLNEIKTDIDKTKNGLSDNDRKQITSRIQESLSQLSVLPNLDQNINNAIDSYKNGSSKPSKKNDFLKAVKELKNAIEKNMTKGNDLTKSISQKIQIGTSMPYSISRDYKDWFNEQLGYLHHQIKAEKSYYTKDIEPYDLGKIWAVNVKLDNERITNQRGAFFIFGLGVKEVSDCYKDKQLMYSKETYPLIPEEWIAKRITIGRSSVNSSSNAHAKGVKTCKEEILKDLKTLGIHHSFVFPDLANVASEINDSLLK
ncbi:FRG domain-containing protein [Porphyromonas levii]|uniref:FRG domain-containing protein n=1 Tax=Porphyromonas levii TaxID=28114 RepID=UPI001B8C9EA9|nr:FRG domain-containing protein [Porphyromonas levii]MBR8712828.1 hypothetical protein [Porphyromonas levii]MBR8714876.1 hypothetical protein [Porphyromonas levii]MBR8727360.1 hypothetical protein [Porphyromonas levii]MBR8735708.1 hypothetical protein [Porphyromonas levii]MBR8777780.1 hypothetical protein [Porphyromonas levii]